MTTYTWDEAKRKSNLRKHGLDFADAYAVFDSHPFTYEDTRFHYDERRYITLGYFNGSPACVTYTENDYEIRIISFRKASREERDTLYRGSR
jgi:uncharacterized DUF497 family protein